MLCPCFVQCILERRDDARSCDPILRLRLAQELDRNLAVALLVCADDQRGPGAARVRLPHLRLEAAAPDVLHDGVTRRPQRFGERKSEIVRLIHRIESFGCIVKDIDLGLLDFPSTSEGEPIYLCWRIGERRIQYWHRADEGFTERKEL